MITYKCEKCSEEGIIHNSLYCPVCGERMNVVQSQIYWCNSCQVPLYDKVCSLCGQHEDNIVSMSTDIRPVFLQERILVGILLYDNPGYFIDKSVWNGSGNYYFIDGKKVRFSVKGLKNVDIEEVRRQYEEAFLQYENTENAVTTDIARFICANQKRYEAITKEALDYIQKIKEEKQLDIRDMFVSFSGGKDSTVTSDLVRRALGTPKILHIFGDTTLEFDDTYEYISRFRKENPSTPLITAVNKEKDFKQLCMQVGPPSRVMRWCCTIFKTGAITRKISALFRKKNRIVSFYGIRRSESVSRSKYERESQSPKITKQITISPIMEWMDFDIWLYMLTTEIDFNEAYKLGYARVGCWCCPNNSGWSEFLSKIHMPEKAKEFRELLIAFATQIGKPDAEVYVDDGKWKARQGGNGVVYAKTSRISFEPCATEENTFYYHLQKPIQKDLYELFRPFGDVHFDLGNTRKGEVYISGKDGRMLLRLQGRTGSYDLKITVLHLPFAGAGSIKAAEEKIKCQITKYQMCMGCLACESICRFDAIKIKEKPDGTIDYKITEQSCRQCTECVSHYVAGCYMRKVLFVKE